VVNRLHVHTVADDTGSGPYIQGAARLLTFVREHQVPFESPEDKDAALADCLSWFCYHEEADLQVGKNIYFGALYVLPNLNGATPQARRALKGWERFAITDERSAVPWEAIHGVARQMQLNGAPECSDIAELAADCYLRAGDWGKLRPEDVVASGIHRVGLLLGRGDRGEAAKTGSNQTVLIDREGIASKVLEYRDEARRLGRKFLFKTSVSESYKRWNLACRQLGYDAGPPHCLRHCGPSFDLLPAHQGKPYRTIEQVQARGRWALLKSVQRYAKSVIYIKAQLDVPPQIAKLGRSRARAVGCRSLFSLS